MLAASLLAFGVAWALQPNLAANGLHARYSTGTDRLERVAFLTANDELVDANPSLSVKWTGYLYQPHASQVNFHIPSGVQARLVIGDDTVFDTFAASPTTDQAVAYLAAGFNPIAFEVTTNPANHAYFQAGLEWQDPVRWQLVPAIYLYPELRDPVAADQIIQQSLIALGLNSLGLLLALAFVISLLWPGRAVWRSRTAVGLALIVVLAFALRLIFLSNYAAQPTADIQGLGSDNQSYQAGALDFVRGLWPPHAPFYVQPGMSLFLGSLYKLFGPNLRLAQLVQMILGALTSLLIFDIARRAFNPLTGWLAAILWAIFPLPIFYEAQVLTHGLEPILGAVLLFLWVRTLEKHDSLAYPLA